MPYVIITGPRTWWPWKVMRRELERLPADVVVVHGGNPAGVDAVADRVARHDLGLKVLPYPADWDRWGRAAGPRRNGEMLDAHRDASVLAFHPDPEELERLVEENVRGSGTADCVRQAYARDRVVRIIGP